MSEVVITIDGLPFRGFEATNIQRNLDSIADGFTFTGAYNPNDVNASYLEPPQKNVTLSIDGDDYITAVAEKWNPGFEKNSTITSIECRTRPGVLVDCTSTAQTTTYKNQTLQDIANAECEPFGISCEFPDGNSPQIKIAQRCPTDTIYSFLKKLACSYEFIATSTAQGNLSFVKPSLSSEPVDSFDQGTGRLLSIDTSFDFSKRFSEYTASGQLPGKPDAVATVVDSSMTQYRPIMFKADAKDQSSLEQAAKWRMTRALVSSEITIKVDGWRDRSGNLWRENTIVSVKAPNVYLFQSYDYLIKNVVLDKTENDGETATLTLVMPESFTGEFPRYLPWVRP